MTYFAITIHTNRKFVLKFVIIPLLWIFYITFATTSNRPCCQDNRTVLLIDPWLVKYNNIFFCWCVWMENTCCEVLWISFFCSWNGRERVRENGWKSILSGFIGQTSEAVELFFVLELCRDRAVVYQWVQLGGADVLSGMSKNLTKIGWRGNGNRDKSLVSSIW